MGKRKRNQQAKPADDQNAVLPQLKKLKASESTTPNATPKVKQPKKKSLATAPNPKQQVTDKDSISAAKETPVMPGPSKAAAKRERHRKKLREAKKKPASGDGAETQETPKQSEQNIAPKKEPTTSTPEQSKSKAVHRKSRKTHVKVRHSKGSSSKEASRKPLHATTTLPSKKTHSSDTQANGPSLTNGESKESNGDQPVAKKSKKQREASKKPPSARKRRRQKLRMAKQAAALGDSEKSLTISDDTEASTSAPTVEDPKVVASLFDEATKTHLLSRPVKQWVEQEELEHDDEDSASAKSAQNDPPTDQSSPSLRSSPERTDSPSLFKSVATASKGDVPESFATVGVPLSNQASATTSTPTTRPGINTIASFSMSSRRHPASVLSKQRTMSGLSSIRMDTGMIGSSPKPVNALKANSVPSSSGPGDAKAAFHRFQKFAHGGNSSESDDDSDASESESDDEVKGGAAHVAGAASHAKANASVPDDVEHGTDQSRDEANGVTTRTIVTRPVQGQVDKIADDDASSSAGSSDSEVEAIANHEAAPHNAHDDEAAAAQLVSDLNATAPNDGGDMLVQSPNEAPQMPGQKELPSFSAFNAMHNINPTDTGVEHAANFLGSELGGGLSGSVHADDKSRNADLLNIDYVASQDVDETYRSINDICSEVFGPDCKPPLNSLDIASEHIVTDHLSGHGLGRKSAELNKTPEKATALSLSAIPSGISPVVWAVNHSDMSSSIVSNDADVHADRQSEKDGEADDVESKTLHTTHETELDRDISSTSSSSPTCGEDKFSNSSAETKHNPASLGDESLQHPSNDQGFATEVKKRKLTGTTSKHFSPTKSEPKTRSSRAKPKSTDDETVEPPEAGDDIELSLTSHDPAEMTASQQPKKKKGTGKTSAFFTPTSSPSKTSNQKKTTPRPPKGTSTCPVPSTHSTYFGLIQEKLWDQPFWLIIAVTFLNKTAGRTAAPIFWSLKELYPTPEALSQAKEEDLVEMIGTLGLQNQRAKRIIRIAKAWIEAPPVKGQRYRTLHYPAKGDGKGIKKDEIVEEDDDNCAGALEIGHIPGCGPYAYDSWRIFCRDVQRGLAKDFNGRKAKGVGFEPEWQRVVPLDKELRACLRWMWLREGYVWDHETGNKRDATLQEMEAAMKGEMEIVDEDERKFAMEAADVTGNKVSETAKDQDVDKTQKSASQAKASEPAKKARSRKMSIAQRELDVEPEDERAVTSVRRSRRNKTG